MMPFWNLRVFSERVRDSISAAALWDELSKTDWFCLDCELDAMVLQKAQALLQEQYAPVGTAAEGMLGEAVKLLDQAKGRGLDLAALAQRTVARRDMAVQYVATYGRYCWPVKSVDDLKLAPFHMLASEGQVHIDKPRDWHMQTLAKLAGGILIATRHQIIDLANEASVGVWHSPWWEQLHRQRW